MAKVQAASKADKQSKSSANEKNIKHKAPVTKVTKVGKPVRGQSSISEDSDSDEDSDDQPDNEKSDDSSQSDSEGESSSDSDTSQKLGANGTKNSAKPSKSANGTKRTNGIRNASASDSESDHDSTSSESEDSDSDHDAPAKHEKTANGKAEMGHEKKHNSKNEQKANSKNIGRIAKELTETSDNESDADDSSKSSGSSEGVSGDSSDEEVEHEAVQTESLGAKKRKADAVDSPKAKKSKMDASATSANLFVGNLSWNVDEEWLQREFAEFGNIAGCRIIRDRDSGRSKGFGYVEFSDASNAAEALETKKGALLDGREMNVDFSVPRPDNANGPNRSERVNDRASKFGDSKSNPSDTLFIGNIAFSATAEELQETFGEYGNVTRVSLPTDQESGAPKGFGYVSFTSVDEAKGALEALNGESIGGRAIRLDYATPRASGDRGGRSARGDFRGGRGGDRGGRGGRGAPRGGRGDFRGRGGRGFSTNRGGIGDFSGKKLTF